MSARRVCVFGGTFDPIHNAHLRIAGAAVERFGLDQVLFVPAGNPPHKESANVTSYHDRLRAGLAPEDKLFFLIGADAFDELETWRRWQDVVRLTEFIVVSRPGRDYHVPENAKIHRLQGLELPVSSSTIRARLAAGEPTPELPAEVRAFIEQRGLYGSRPRP